MSNERKRHEAVEQARNRENDIPVRGWMLPEGDMRAFNMEDADENRKSAWERARVFLAVRNHEQA